MTSASQTLSIGSRIAQRMAEKLGPQQFGVWFGKKVQFDYQAESNTLAISAPHRMAASWIERHYQLDLQEACREETGHNARIAVTVSSQPSSPARPKGSTATLQRPKRDGSTDSPESSAKKAEALPNALPLRYSLDNFITGPSNQMAALAARTMSDPDNTMAPHSLFLHGGSGLGKTHLLQGAVREYLKKRPLAKVLYTTGEAFTNAYIEAVRYNQTESFRLQYRSLELLAIDDVHFVAGKDKTQNELLCCIDALGLRGARLLLASDCHPKMIHAFTEKLTSLCLQGLVVDVHAPDTATRLSLISGLAARRGMQLENSAQELLAQEGPDSVRELEGMLTNLHMISAMRPQPLASSPVDCELVRKALQINRIATPAKPPRFENILDVCCDRLGVTTEQVCGKSKQGRISLARACVVMLCREMTALSYPEIARYLGRRGHSTAITAHQRIQKMIDQNEPLQQPGLPMERSVADMVDELRREIRSR